LRLVEAVITLGQSSGTDKEAATFFFRTLLLNLLGIASSDFVDNLDPDLDVRSGCKYWGILWACCHGFFFHLWWWELGLFFWVRLVGGAWAALDVYAKIPFLLF